MVLGIRGICVGQVWFARWSGYGEQAVSRGLPLSLLSSSIHGLRSIQHVPLLGRPALWVCTVHEGSMKGLIWQNKRSGVDFSCMNHSRSYGESRKSRDVKPD